MSPKTPSNPREVDSDPEEDLDDLDDVLTQFTPIPLQKQGLGPPSQLNQPQSPSQLPPTSPLTSPPPPPPTATTTTFNRPRTNTRVDAHRPSVTADGKKLDSAAEEDEDALTAEFARELAKGMESLMKEIGAGGDGKESKDGEDGKELTEEEKEQGRVFKAAWEAMLVEGMDGMTPGGSEGLGDVLGEGGVKGKSTTTEGGEKDFQKKIRQAMDKLKESESTLQADDSTQNQGVPSEESMEALLASLAELGRGGDGEDGEGGENEEELAGLLESMMGQLMSKEVLYEPLKELCEKFPPYLSTNRTTLPAAEITRYESQLASVHKIIAVFEKPGYDESDPETGKQVTELMGEMQSFGSPPAEIMGPLPPGLGAGPDGMPQMPEGCVIG